MTHYAIVVADAEKDAEAEVGRLRRGGIRESVARQVIGTRRRPVGALHAHLTDACPDGGKNCRNCGDPSFAVSCQAAGHCPVCGTQHGIAPQSVVAAAGLALREIPTPGPDEDWDIDTQRFVARTRRPGEGG